MLFYIILLRLSGELIPYHPVADLFYRLFDAVTKDPQGTPHGKNGYYFANEGVFTMYEYTTAIGETLKRLGKIQDAIPKSLNGEQLKEFFTVGLFIMSSIRIITDLFIHVAATSTGNGWELSG